MINRYRADAADERFKQACKSARQHAACRAAGLKYSVFMGALKNLNIEMDRKQLSELAINDEAAFAALVKKVVDSIKK